MEDIGARLMAYTWEYVGDPRARRAKLEPLPLTRPQQRMKRMLLDGMLHFVLGHELEHIALEHINHPIPGTCSGVAAELAVTRWSQEIAADAGSAILLADYVSSLPREARGFMRWGNEDPVWSDEPDAVGGPLAMRMIGFLEQLRSSLPGWASRADPNLDLATARLGPQ